MLRIGSLTLILSYFLVTAVDVTAQDLNPRTISVSGEGVHAVEPDVAVVRFGVVTRDTEPEAARRDNASAAARAMDAVRGLGIEERSIRMENLRLQPWREWNNEARRWEERGFEAVRDIVVRVEDLNRLPEVVTRVVQEGANRLNQVSYEIRDRQAAGNIALTKAVEAARAKAELMTSTLGVRLGEVRSISEQQYDFPRPMYRNEVALSAAMDVAAPEPNAYAAGEIEVRATVHLVFDLLPTN